MTETEMKSLAQKLTSAIEKFATAKPDQFRQITWFSHAQKEKEQRQARFHRAA